MESNKNDTNELLYKTERLTNLKIKHGYKGEIWGEVID